MKRSSLKKTLKYTTMVAIIPAFAVSQIGVAQFTVVQSEPILTTTNATESVLQPYYQYDGYAPPIYHKDTTLDGNGWALINGTNTFDQIFVNNKVATYFATLINKKPTDLMTANDLTAIATAITVKNSGKIDLSTLYLDEPVYNKNDFYLTYDGVITNIDKRSMISQTNSIKALNNPNLQLMLSTTTHVDLSHNDLCYVPNFGGKGLVGNEHVMMFNNLIEMNLEYNCLTYIDPTMPDIIAEPVPDSEIRNPGLRLDYNSMPYLLIFKNTAPSKEMGGISILDSEKKITYTRPLDIFPPKTSLQAIPALDILKIGIYQKDASYVKSYDLSNYVSFSLKKDGLPSLNELYSQNCSTENQITNEISEKILDYITEYFRDISNLHSQFFGKMADSDSSFWGLQDVWTTLFSNQYKGSLNVVFSYLIYKDQWCNFEEYDIKDLEGLVAYLSDHYAYGMQKGMTEINGFKRNDIPLILICIFASAAIIALVTFYSIRIYKNKKNYKERVEKFGDDK